MNPKILQYLMGHSNIEITLGYYTHARYEDAKAELDRSKNCSTEARKRILCYILKPVLKRDDLTHFNVKICQTLQ